MTSQVDEVSDFFESEAETLGGLDDLQQGQALSWVQAVPAGAALRFGEQTPRS